MKSLSPGTFVKAIAGIMSAKPMKLPDELMENTVIKLMLNRRSIRKFKKEPIPESHFDLIIESARLAPSTVNLQTWSFGVYDTEQWRRIFGTPMPFNGVRAVIILGDMHRNHQVLDDFPFKPLVEYTLCTINASIAAYAMNIAAESMGIGSVMLSDTGKSGFYDGLYLKDKMGLPDSVFPVMTMVFGYPDGKPKAMPPKLRTEDIIFTGKYKETERKATEEWLRQMQAGYRALSVTQSFKDKLNHYLKKSDDAEAGLHKMIFHKKEGFKTKIR